MSVQKTSKILVQSKPVWLPALPVFDIIPIRKDDPSILLLRPHIINFYELIWIFSGSGQRVVDFQSHALKAHRVFFMSPGPVHMWDKPRKISGMFFFISENFLFQTMGAGKSLPAFFSDPSTVPYVDLVDQPSFYTLLQQIQHEYQKDSPWRTEILTAYLRVLLTKLGQVHHPTVINSSGADLASRFRRELNNHFKTHRQVSDYASLLHVSANHLNDVIGSETGRSVGTWIRQRVMLEAKRILSHSESSVAAAAQELHFDDVAYFCRFFRKYAGETPRTFQKGFQQRG